MRGGERLHTHEVSPSLPTPEWKGIKTERSEVAIAPDAEGGVSEIRNPTAPKARMI